MKRFDYDSDLEMLRPHAEGEWVRYDDIPTWRTVETNGAAKERRLVCRGNIWRVAQPGAWLYEGDRYIPLSELRRLPGGGES